MDMIEKVAIAIAADRAEPWDKMTDDDRMSFQQTAKAAIEAMRAPSNEMLAAMWNAMFEEAFDGTQAPMCGAGYDAAIDTALKGR